MNAARARTPEADPESVSCPTCLARPWYPCEDLMFQDLGDKAPASRPHPARRALVERVEGWESVPRPGSVWRGGEGLYGLEGRKLLVERVLSVGDILESEGRDRGGPENDLPNRVVVRFLVRRHRAETEYVEWEPWCRYAELVQPEKGEKS